MRIVLAGSSGAIGRPLVAQLKAAGHTTHRLVRRPAQTSEETSWDPAAGRLDPAVLRGSDVVVNLCGGPVDRRWTARNRRDVIASRIPPTRLLAQACAEAGVPTYVCASGAGWYGDGGDSWMDETDSAGPGWRCQSVMEWESAAQAARDAGVRTASARFGFVLLRDAVLLRRLVPLFRAGLGGRIGHGQQFMPWIGGRDCVRVLRFLIERPVAGPVNVVAPDPVRQAGFAQTLAAALGRRSRFALPAWAARAAWGAMADEVLLRSQRLRPRVLENAGFRFEEGDVAVALRNAMGDTARPAAT